MIALIRDRVKSQVEKSLTQPAINTLTKYISDYIDRNSDILLSLDLSKRFSFADQDRQPIFDVIGVSIEEMTQLIRDSKDIHNGNKIHSNPFYCACMICMWQLLRMKKEKEAMLIMNYMSLMMYIKDSLIMLQISR